MAMKKADLETHRDQYNDLMSRARTAEKNRLYRDAIESALSAWDYIDAMMKYERKYEKKTFTTIAAIELIFKYAPLLFDFKSLNKLASLLKDYKGIERHTSVTLGERLVETRKRMWDNHRLWNHLEWHPDCRQDSLRDQLGGTQDNWRAVAEA